MFLHNLICRDERSGLIIARVMLNDIFADLVIDTGATASFLPRNGLVMNSTKLTLEAHRSDTRTADNNRLDCTHLVHGNVAIWAQGIQEARIRFRIMNNARDILGYDGLLGTDAIKALSIHVVPVNDRLVAKVNSCVIGEERVAGPEQPCLAVKTPCVQPCVSPLDKLLTIYADVFAEQATGVMHTPPMYIPLLNPGTPKARLRRSSEEDIEEIRKQVNSMLDRGIIEPSISPFSANCHLVPKKNGQKRLVINYIPLNRIAEKDHYPLPQISDLMMHLTKAKYFCALDCTEGFWQVAVAKKERHKTAFITPHGQYQFKRCPFGFTNSPAIFQRAMNSIFADGLYRRCVIYVDDILVFGQTETETLSNLEWVLRKCKENNVKLKASKCEFMKNSVKFLGYIVQSGMIAPIAARAEEWIQVKPESPNDVLAILGSLNYYSRFIENYSEKTQPLRLAIRNEPFRWTDDCRNTVKQLAHELQNSKPQVLPDCKSPKIIELAALEHSIEAYCTTMDGQLISRTSALLSDPEKRYTQPEKELLSLIRAYDKFNPILKGRVTVRSSCLALSPLMKLKDKPERVIRLLLKLPPDANFNLEVTNSLPNDLRAHDAKFDEIFYTDGACVANGKENCRASWAVIAIHHPHLNASGLLGTRNQSSQKAELEAIRQACLIAKRETYKSIAIVSDSKYAITACTEWMHKWQSNGWRDNRNKDIKNKEELLQLLSDKDGLTIRFVHVKGHQGDRYNELADQLARDELKKTIDYCAAISDPPIFDQDSDNAIVAIKEKLYAGEEVTGYTMEDDILYRLKDDRMQLVIPISQRYILLKLAHDDPLYGSHLGVKKTKRKLEDYFWPGKSADIESHIKSCNICQHHKTKKGKPYGLLKSIKTSSLFERIHLDVVGPINQKTTGNRYIITAIDAFSRYAKVKVCSEVSTDCVMKFFTKIVQEHGPPDHLVTDNGPQFKAAPFQEYLGLIGVHHSTTCEYHPQANGMDERFNATLLKLIRNMTRSGGSELEHLVPWCVLAYNLTQHEATGLSPYTVLFGRIPRSPLQFGRKEAPGDETPHAQLRQFALENIKSSQEKSAAYYNQKRTDLNLEPLDLVMIKTRRVPRTESKKLYPKWSGPCCVLKVIKHDNQPMAVEILDSEDCRARRVPFCDIQPYISSRKDGNYPLPGERLILSENRNDNENAPMQMYPSVPADFSPSKLLDLQGDEATGSLPETETLSASEIADEQSPKVANTDDVMSSCHHHQSETQSDQQVSTVNDDSCDIISDDVIKESDFDWEPTEDNSRTGRGVPKGCKSIDRVPQAGCKFLRQETEAGILYESPLEIESSTSHQRGKCLRRTSAESTCPRSSTPSLATGEKGSQGQEVDFSSTGDDPTSILPPDPAVVDHVHEPAGTESASASDSAVVEPVNDPAVSLIDDLAVAISGGPAGTWPNLQPQSIEMDASPIQEPTNARQFDDPIEPVNPTSSPPLSSTPKPQEKRRSSRQRRSTERYSP